MQQPTMNAAKMAKCMKSGRSRADCEKEIYPGRSAKKKGGGKKAPPPFKKGGY